MKRSTTASLVLMGLAPLLLTACDDGGPSTTQQSFTTVDQCVQAGVPKDTCDKAHKEAVANAQKASPHFGTLDQCIAQFGTGMCQQSSGDHGSFWMPMLGGFLIGRMLDNNTNNSGYVPAGPIYRSAGGGYYSPPSNGVYGGSYRSSSSGWSSSASASRGGGSAGSRAITSSRGGFGSAHAMAGHWGG